MHEAVILISPIAAI